MAPRRLDWAIFEKNDGEIMAAALGENGAFSGRKSSPCADACTTL